VFKALADPHRVKILNLLATNPDPVCVCEFTEPLGLSQPTVSHHLKVLVNAGLLAVRILAVADDSLRARVVDFDPRSDVEMVAASLVYAGLLFRFRERMELPLLWDSLGPRMGRGARG
jgi:DNA-binding transcriptional ArsR family regulator